MKKKKILSLNFLTCKWELSTASKDWLDIKVSEIQKALNDCFEPQHITQMCQVNSGKVESLSQSPRTDYLEQ